MDDITLFKLWKTQDEEFNKNDSLIKKNMHDISQIKVKSFLSSMKPMKIFTILFGIIWVGVVGTLVFNLSLYAGNQVSLFFLSSAAIQVLLTAVALVAYIYQLILIYRVDIAEPIVKTQETLVRLKTSTLWITKVLFLQFPLWTTFYLSQKIFIGAHVSFLIVQVILTGSFTYLALWLFFNIRYENRNRKWFKLIFNGSEWIPLLKSMELLEQIDDYKLSSNTN